MKKYSFKVEELHQNVIPVVVIIVFGFIEKPYDVGLYVNGAGNM